jgi:hypothetical protein
MVDGGEIHSIVVYTYHSFMYPGQVIYCRHLFHSMAGVCMFPVLKRKKKSFSLENIKCFGRNNKKKMETSKKTPKQNEVIYKHAKKNGKRHGARFSARRCCVLCSLELFSLSPLLSNGI